MTGRATFAQRMRDRDPILGYWSVLDCPISAEWLAHVGWDYIALDLQHGLIGYAGMITNLTAIDAAGGPVSMVRVEANDAATIGRAFDGGASGVIVPLINTAAEAAVSSRQRSTPLRGPVLRPDAIAAADRADSGHRRRRDRRPCDDRDAAGNCQRRSDLCDTGTRRDLRWPTDLRLALGGATSTDPSIDERFEETLARIRTAAQTAGIHTSDGQTAARRLADGFTLASVASDLVHLRNASAQHLEHARAGLSR